MFEFIRLPVWRSRNFFTREILSLVTQAASHVWKVFSPLRMYTSIIIDTFIYYKCKVGSLKIKRCIIICC